MAQMAHSLIVRHASHPGVLHAARHESLYDNVFSARLGKRSTQAKLASTFAHRERTCGRQTVIASAKNNGGGAKPSKSKKTGGSSSQKSTNTTTKTTPKSTNTSKNSNPSNKQAKAAPPVEKKPSKPKWFGPPLDVFNEEVLTPVEPATEPWWSTFSGHQAGLWRGKIAAFDPVTGESELLTMTSAKQKLFELPTECKVKRYEEGEMGSSASVEQVLVQLTPEADADSEEGAELATFTKAEAEVSEVMAFTEPGLVWFQDGSYSRGPVVMEPAEGEDILTVTFENCLYLSGKQRRVRVFQTVQMRPMGGEGDWVLEDQLGIDEDLVLQEFDDDDEEAAEGSFGDADEDADEDKDVEIQLLRVSVVHEEWAGPLGSNLASSLAPPSSEGGGGRDALGSTRPPGSGTSSARWSRHCRRPPRRS